VQPRLDPLALLARTDKWFLGGGKAALYAPAFPKHLDTPGFWDEAYFADIRLERLYCLLLLDERGKPLPLRCALRRWTPDCLTLLYTVEGRSGLRVQEERVLTGNDTLASRLTFQNAGGRAARLHVLLWSLQETQALSAEDPRTLATAEAVERAPDALSFAHRLHYGVTADTPAEVHGWGQRTTDGRTVSAHAEEAQRVFVALGGDRQPDSWTVNLAEKTETLPLWQLSVFPEKFRNGVLAQEMQAEAGWNPQGLLHLALHYAVEVAADSTDSRTFGAALALDRETALTNLRNDLAHDVVTTSRANWQTYFASVPAFTCSDPYLETAYWYRWYGLRLLTVEAGAGQLPYPCVFEGIGAFRSHITYSAQCHLRELSWQHDPAAARGTLLNFLAAQTRTRDQQGEDGFLPGHLYLWRRDRGFYHANWGRAALQFYYLTGDADFVEQIYPGLVRYALYFERQRDREQSGLYDVLDQGETGQEYMSRYLFVDASADAWRPIQVKGVDATCYLYDLQCALAVFARLLDRPQEGDHWAARAEATAEAVRARMWDDEAQLFKDVHPTTFAQSPFKAAVGFYPFLSDIAGDRHLGAFAHLTNPDTFGTPYLVPASSVDDPYFNAEADWKGKRTNCPWNGRVWPMTNSHVADALAHAARTLAWELRPAAAAFLNRTVRLLFHEGDPKRPNCYEHYNPYTGTPSLYRGVDDYQHSWIVDLIIRHVVGIQPEPEPNGALVIDPLPFGLREFRIEGVPIRGHRVDVSWSFVDGFEVRVDGRERLRLPELRRVEVKLN
jgi:hypothetical protein